eukprot:9245618-Pyramimonas_sp.AAC.1
MCIRDRLKPVLTFSFVGVRRRRRRVELLNRDRVQVFSACLSMCDDALCRNVVSAVNRVCPDLVPPLLLRVRGDVWIRRAGAVVELLEDWLDWLLDMSVQDAWRLVPQLLGPLSELLPLVGDAYRHCFGQVVLAFMFERGQLLY